MSRLQFAAGSFSKGEALRESTLHLLPDTKLARPQWRAREQRSCLQLIDRTAHQLLVEAEVTGMDGAYSEWIILASD